jgi:hypothetical protein
MLSLKLLQMLSQLLKLHSLKSLPPLVMQMLLKMLPLMFFKTNLMTSQRLLERQLNYQQLFLTMSYQKSQPH